MKNRKDKSPYQSGVLTTGFDAPLTDMIALLKATKFLCLYVQILGRRLRISPETGKTDCLVLEYGGNVERHVPIDRITIDHIKVATSKVTGITSIGSPISPMSLYG